MLAPLQASQRWRFQIPRVLMRALVSMHSSSVAVELSRTRLQPVQVLKLRPLQAEERCELQMLRPLQAKKPWRFQMPRVLMRALVAMHSSSQAVELMRTRLQQVQMLKLCPVEAEERCRLQMRAQRRARLQQAEERLRSQMAGATAAAASAEAAASATERVQMLARLHQVEEI